MAKMRAEPSWRKRESALLWGAPMTLFATLAFVPVTVSLLIDPAFAHARWLGCALLPVIGGCIASGLAKLATCFRGDFDLLAFFAGGTAFVLVVIAMCEGVILAGVISRM